MSFILKAIYLWNKMCVEYYPCIIQPIKPVNIREKIREVTNLNFYFKGKLTEEIYFHFY